VKLRLYLLALAFSPKERLDRELGNLCRDILKASKTQKQQGAKP
jgi:hypothetical protein